MKPWSQQNHVEKKETINYVAKLAGALLVVLSWFAIGIVLVLPILATACLAFGYRDQISSIGAKRELKEREEYLRLKKKYG